MERRKVHAGNGEQVGSKGNKISHFSGDLKKKNLTPWNGPGEEKSNGGPYERKGETVNQIEGTFRASRGEKTKSSEPVGTRRPN